MAASLPRQPKLTESYSLKKTSELKVTLKRKLVVVGAEEEDEENAGGRGGGCGLPVGVDVAQEFHAAKTALHLARPTRLIAREAQLEEVASWLDAHLAQRTPGAMYISGAPGTGKTAVVLHAIHSWMEKHPAKSGPPCYHLVVNCMGISSPHEIYHQMALLIRAPNAKTAKGDALKDTVISKLMTGNKASKLMVLVLDEMDQLVNGKGPDVVYSLFQCARTSGSRLIVIGLANALDLTVRHLPLLAVAAAQNSPSSSPSPLTTTSTSGSANSGTAATPKTRGRKPKTPTATKKPESEKSSAAIGENDSSAMKIINFPPYDRSEIEKILEARLMEIGSNLFDTGAIKFVAAKVAATTGDMRKALNACKLALDAVEKQQRQILKSTTDDGFNFASPKKCCIVKEKITVGTVAKVFAPPKDDGPLPLQQMIILATLLKIHKSAPLSRQPKVDGVVAPIPMVQVYEEYRKICTTKGFSWIDRSDIASVCSMLQDRSLVTVVENMSGGNTKAKKFGTLNSTNKTGFLFSLNAVEKIVMQCDMKAIICD